MVNSVFIVALVMAAGIASIELGISTAILEILAGVIGYNLFGFTDISWIEELSNFGMLGIMFFAGFETDVKILKRYFKKSFLIACASYMTPFILTLIVGSAALGLTGDAVILLAIGMSTTSLALVYPYLQSEGLLKDKIAQILLAAAMIVDIMSMMSLTILISGFDSQIMLIICAIGIGMYFLPDFGKWIFKRYGENHAEIELRFIFLTLVGLAFLSEYVGIHAAVFAYLIGMILSSIIEDQQALEKKLRGVVYGFFGPLFFFYSGYLIDLSVFDLNTVKITLLLTIVAFTGKYIGTRLSVRWILGRGSRLSSLFFNFRLSFGIIVTRLGYQVGLIDRDLYTAALATILATSIIASLLLKITPTETLYKRRVSRS